MKKLLLSFFVLIFAILVFASVSDTIIRNYDTDQGKLSMKFYKGWNVVSKKILSSSSIDSEEAKKCNLKAVFVYSPKTKKYYGGGTNYVPPQEFNDLMSSETNEGYYYAEFEGGWLNVGSDCSLTVNGPKESELQKTSSIIETTKNKFKMRQGWNFVLMHPYAEGLSFSTHLGTCFNKFEKLAAWNPQTQKWDSVVKITETEKEKFKKTEISRDVIWNTYLMKFSDECQFSLEEGSDLMPPALPE